MVTLAVAYGELARNPVAGRRKKNHGRPLIEKKTVSRKQAERPQLPSTLAAAAATSATVFLSILFRPKVLTTVLFL